MKELMLPHQQALPSIDKLLSIFVVNHRLSGGIPRRSGVFPSDSPYQNVEIVRALFHAAKIIEHTKELPSNAGSPWTPEEQQKIITDYQNGTPIAHIAKEHQRTPRAIRSRLRKAGIIEN